MTMWGPRPWSSHRWVLTRAGAPLSTALLRRRPRFLACFMKCIKNLAKSISPEGVTSVDRALIRTFAAEEFPKARITKCLRISWSTVVKPVSSPAPPRDERKTVETLFCPFEARVRALLVDFPEMPAVVPAESFGWAGFPSCFRENPWRIRPQYRRVKPADGRVWETGDVIQCDFWFPSGNIPVEDGSTELWPVLVMTAGFSRFTTGRFLPARNTSDLLFGMAGSLQGFDKVITCLI